MAAAANLGVTANVGKAFGFLMRTTVGYLEKGRTQAGQEEGSYEGPGGVDGGLSKVPGWDPGAWHPSRCSVGGPSHRCSWRLKNDGLEWPLGGRGWCVIESQAEVSESPLRPSQRFQEREQDVGDEMRR